MKPTPLRMKRLRKGLTGTAVARALGVSKTFLYQLESGERPVPAKHKPKLRKLYGS